jgi:hypothetical protein
MKVTRKGACGAGNRSLVFDSARLHCLLEEMTPLFLNILIDADHRKIAQFWLSLRRPARLRGNHEGRLGGVLNRGDRGADFRYSKHVGVDRRSLLN